LAIEDQSTGRLRGFDNVFAMGNAVTGRGNIKESVSHSRETIVRILDTRDWERQYGYEDRIIQEEIQSAEAIQKITYELGEKKPPANAEISHILSRVAQLQGKAGYDGHYDKWIKSHLPIRLEDLSDQEN